MSEKSNKRKKISKSISLSLKQKFQRYLAEIRQLEGDPNYVARGMAIGVFIGMTPTIPLHTILAIALAFIFRGSKPAAVIGVWVANPLTIPFFYITSYQIGIFLFKISTPFNPTHISIHQLIELGFEITIAMVIGGMVLGIPFGIIAYCVTWRIIKSIRSSKENIEKPVNER